MSKKIEYCPKNQIKGYRKSVTVISARPCYPISKCCLNISTTHIMAMGCRQCLPLSVVHMKEKHCQKPQCRYWVVDMFGPGVQAVPPATTPET